MFARVIRPLYLGLVAAALCAGCNTEPELERPSRHVLVILLDTLRADRLSCYGYDRPTSPFIDSLAQRGTRFTGAAAQSSWTSASMVSLFTGRLLAEERIQLPEGVPSLPVLFRRRGWDTGAFVVNPLVHNAENGFRRGFRHFVPNGDLNKITAWLRRSAGRDTFTYVHFVDPHDPYAPLPEYQHFVHQPANLPAELREHWTRVRAERGLVDDPAAMATIERGWNGYDDDVRLADSKVQILVEALRESGQLDDALIVIASDHGEGLWTRLEFEHALPEQGPLTLENTHKMTHGNQVYEELVRVPLVIVAPGLPGGVVVDGPVQNIDLLPTLLELCDLPLPGGIDGQSLVPLLAGGQAQGQAFSVTRFAHALRTADEIKLILPTEHGRSVGLAAELYDLGLDPAERTDLAADRPETVAQLTRRIEDLLAAGLRAEEGEFELSEANRAAMDALGYTD